MGDLSSYSLSDFILFSDTAYYRQFELYNQAIWPLHVVAGLFAALVFYALWKRPHWGGRAITVVLVISWLWVAWAFLYSRFDQLHVVADKYAIGFVVQAFLMAWSGLVKNHFRLARAGKLKKLIGSGLLFIGAIAYPLMAVLSGRDWLQFEMFGLAPDPTALVTVAVLLFVSAPRLLYILPISWLVISAVTLVAMH